MYYVVEDIKVIKNMLEDFYALAGIRIAFCSHDRKKFISVPVEQCDFCNILRKDQEADRQCRECDDRAFKLASNTGKPLLYDCHAGITEAVSPIIYKDRVLGYLMMGQTLESKPSDELWNKTLNKCKHYDVDLVLLKKAFWELNYHDRERLTAASRIMDTNAKYLYLSRLININEPPLMKKLLTYIESGITKDITINSACDVLKVSKSHLSHLIRSELHTNFTSLILQKRIDKAKILLEETETKIIDIALELGFTDPNYFSRVFKKLTGVSPKQYRIKSRKKAHQC